MARFTTLFAAMFALPLASASELFLFSDPSGLAAEVEFDLLGPTTLEIRARNTSTGVPGSFDSADQILTGISWDFGLVGINGSDPAIASGSVEIGPSSMSIDFDAGAFGPGADVSGEYGYGNMDGSGALPNFFSGNTAGATPFGGPNLDGPDSIDGPQGGMVANPVLVPLGGLGAIQDEVIATLTIDQALSDLDFLSENGVRIEFGSDAAFFTIPEPANFCLLFGCMLIAGSRRVG